MDVKYNTDTKIEDNSRAFKLQKANFDREVNTAVSNATWSRVKVWRKKITKNPLFSLQKAEAQLAYELQAAKIQQKIRNEEIQIQVVERRKQIEIEEQEIRRKEKELMSTVKLPAEAEAYKVQTIAEGKRYDQTVWKSHDFYITQILREFNFGNSRSAKSAILTHWEALNFNFLRFFSLCKD